MVDDMDFAQQYELEAREHYILRARSRNNMPSRFICEVCEAPIPEARRTALPGVVLCVNCQMLVESKQKHYRRTL